eukprot:CAMPEP_0168553192 /NCGR_PEP_ID=MMETSP0413-20121227/7121_1 /TAXON_ID=136452 /ORGANISM="Filamoeba nolandi, Strain NC-AS-23-1" /LENGTH=279 /DNA_ID=CAMNT_0008583861 /DNA_START=49 /DNA_END=885 /DNA_ORIENTATION=-
MNAYDAADVCLPILISLFYFGFLICLFFMIRSLFVFSKSLIGNTVMQLDLTNWPISKIIFCMLPWGLLLRAIDMTAQAKDDYLTTNLNEQSLTTFILGSLPGYWFFSIYFIVVIFWLLLFHRSRDATSNFIEKIRVLYFIINGIVYGMWAAMVVAFSLTKGHKRETIHHVEAIFASALHFTGCIVALTYGTIVYRSLVNMPTKSFVRTRMADKIGILTVILTVCFALRSLSILLNFYAWKNDPTNLIALRVTYHIAFELTPTFVILYVLTKKLPPKHEE